MLILAPYLWIAGYLFSELSRSADTRTDIAAVTFYSTFWLPVGACYLSSLIACKVLGDE
ncbi:hypothetical protein ISO78_06665 [Morganella morganii subsp. morganii]|uniref:hypothetical protein n=1 Tax=Morganella morganii TaxID=582 RepID=UPI001BDB2A29|nr:hypothetical protein [Morganella morganii]MBT0355920.1 hypothetical protein [Morganella morganii subsp. morganii]HCD1132972.1 hypothetical protein [Morganella morganii]